MRLQQNNVILWSANKTETRRKNKMVYLCEVNKNAHNHLIAELKSRHKLTTCIIFLLILDVCTPFACISPIIFMLPTPNGLNGMYKITAE